MCSPLTRCRPRLSPSVESPAQGPRHSPTAESLRLKPRGWYPRPRAAVLRVLWVGPPSWARQRAYNVAWQRPSKPQLLAPTSPLS